MSIPARWTLAVVTVLVVLIGALFAEMRDRPAPGTGPDVSADRGHRDADTPAALAGPRRNAGLAPCPRGGPGGSGPLRGIAVECAADGTRIDVGAAVTGHRVILNLWAHWCRPCRAELPAMAAYQQRIGSRAMVLTVHQDENETAALLQLAELRVHLPTLQDGRRRIAAALAVPNVMPATVVLEPDGSVAQVLPREFTSADEIAAAVDGPA